jgi:hypothetical protein
MSNSQQTKKINKEKKMNLHKRFGFIALGLLILALGAVPAQAETTPVLSVTSGDASGFIGCYDLLAGQTIDAGDVCFEVQNNDTLIVTYTTMNGWELTEAHLWVGDDQDGYPMTKKGNPKIGNFPYNSGDITGATTHEFYVPLGSALTSPDSFDLENLGNYCGQSFQIYAMAHSAVQLVDDSGNVVQTETGWTEGEGVLEKGSWATRSVITLSVTCDGEPPEPPTTGQETAIMFGSIELNDATDTICVLEDGTDAFAANRWGWQEGPLVEGSYQYPIWAAAGQNDTSKGTNVGHVDIVVSAATESLPGNVTVTPVLYEGFTAVETHIYIGTEPVCWRLCCCSLQCRGRVPDQRKLLRIIAASGP